MKKALLFLSFAVLLFGSTSFASATTYVYYATPDSIGEPVSCVPTDMSGDHITCYIQGEDKAWGIVVDVDKAWGIVVDDKAWGIVVDESDSKSFGILVDTD